MHLNPDYKVLIIEGLTFSTTRESQELTEESMGEAFTSLLNAYCDFIKNWNNTDKEWAYDDKEKAFFHTLLSNKESLALRP